MLQNCKDGGGGAIKMEDKLNFFSAQATLEGFCLHLNALLLSLILLHEFQIKFLIYFSEDNCFPQAGSKGLNSQNG